MKVDSSAETSYESPSGANRLFYRTLAGERPDLLSAIITFNRNRNQTPHSANDALSGDTLSDERPSKPHDLSAKDFSWLPEASNRAKARLFPGDYAGF